jgi:hypothetical protein
MKLRSITFILALTLSIKSYAVSYNLSSTWSSNFKAIDTGENSSSSVTSLRISQIYKGYNLGISTALVKDLRDKYSEFNLNNLSFSMSKGHDTFGLFDASSSVSAIIGSSKVSREIKNYFGALKHSLSVPLQLIKNIDSTIIISNVYHFYEFETDLYGNSNTQHQHGIGVSLGHRIHKNVSLYSVAFLNKSFTHSGVANDSFYFDTGINLSWKSLSLSVGYEKADQLLMPNGRNTNLSLFDLDTSSFYISSGISF